jgi:exopolysaccharide production protein ExoZ
LKNRILLIDRLRGFAIISVVALHTNNTLLDNVPETMATHSFSELNVLLRHGVELFFILSGFLMGYLYDGSGSKTNYLSARFFRLWPLWALFTVIWIPVHLALGNEKPAAQLGEGVFNLIFLGWAYPGTDNNFVGGQWSIQIEIFCYLAFAFLKNRRTSTIAVTLLVMNSLGLFNNVLVHYWNPAVSAPLSNLSIWSGFSFFALGVVLARAYSRGTHEMFKNYQALPRRSVLLFGSTISSCVLAPAYYGNFLEAFGYVSVSIILTILISKLPLIDAILTWWGAHSYSVFFNHFFVLIAVNSFLAAVKPPSAALVLIPIFVFLISAVIAKLTERFVERPSIEFGRYLRSKARS